jgi:hypothetical protein
MRQPGPDSGPGRQEIVHKTFKLFPPRSTSEGSRAQDTNPPATRDQPTRGGARLHPAILSLPFRCRLQAAGFRVQGSGLRVEGTGFRVRVHDKLPLQEKVPGVGSNQGFFLPGATRGIANASTMITWARGRTGGRGGWSLPIKVATPPQGLRSSARKPGP